jgi:hypothetical protein
MVMIQKLEAWIVITVMFFDFYQQTVRQRTCFTGKLCLLMLHFTNLFFICYYFIFLTAKVPVLSPDFHKMNCTEIIKLLSYYDNIINIYIHVEHK